MNELQIFKNEEFGEIRSLEINNKPYFVGKDIAKALGYKNTKDALINHVDEDDKKIIQRSEMATIENHIPKEILPVNFVSAEIPNRGLTIINESGVYALVFGSKLPNAKQFKRWVTSEVLPSIRQTGGYIAGEEKMTEDELILKAMNVLNIKVENLKQKNKQLELDNERQNQLIGELKPKADYTDKILSSKGTVTINAIANDYGLTAIAMNKKLHELGIQYKQGDQWLLYRKYRACGYTHSKTIHFYRRDGRPDTKMNMEWTQKGRLFLYELLKKKGIVPTIEKEIA